MGIYINVPHDKRSWFNTYCIKNAPVPHPDDVPELIKSGRVPVVYLNNGAFDAIAVIFSKAEAKRMAQGRPDGVWAMMEKGFVLAACPEAQDALR